ncbi:hypothetical protein EV426DRAFT_103608 [Tirmania nivea]|nr:hypothetical protein EV426DRAFT_103608 [Tirmania nivea]
MPLVALSPAPRPLGCSSPTPYPALLLSILSSLPPGLPPSSLGYPDQTPPPFPPPWHRSLSATCMHIYPSCAWPNRRQRLLALRLPHSLCSCPPAACPAVGIGPAREMCRRSYQREARLWQPWLRTGLTLDGATTRSLARGLCPRPGSGSNLDRYIPAVPSSPTHSPPHTPQSLLVWLRSLLLSSFCECDLSLSAFASILILVIFFVNQSPRRSLRLPGRVRSLLCLHTQRSYTRAHTHTKP